MIFSNFSFTERPLFLQQHFSFSAGAFAITLVYFGAPLEFKNARERSTIFFSLQNITSLGSSVTSATAVAMMFSLSAACMNFSTFSFATTTAILSWDSLIASSVPSKPSYFFGTRSRLIFSPSASSPIATDTPPAPKSLQRLIMRVTSPSRNSLWIFLSSGGLPF